MRRTTFYRFALLSVAFLGVSIVLLGSQDTTPQYPKHDFSKATAYDVIRIVDGDTVDIRMNGKKVRVRLIGVDTPETVHPTKPVEHFGREASNFVKNLLLGEKVWIVYDQQKTDKYGRTLGYLFRAPDGLFVNLEIVRQGYGHAYTKYPFKHMELFRYWGTKARDSGRGLWATPQKTGVAPADVKTGTVYITNSGKKYHRGSCRFLSKSKIPISLKDACKRYGPCGVCRPPVVKK